MSASTSSFQLSCELDPPHQSDVKAVLSLPHGRLATASRDQSVAVWKRSESSAVRVPPPQSYESITNAQAYELEALLAGHRAYVNSLAYIPADENSKDDLLASGGNSSLILLHSLDHLQAESAEVLIGHALNVCTLQYSPTRRRLISGSWDKTARVWSRTGKDWRCERVLDGHDEAVWGVGIIESGPHEGGYLTASADRLIYLWNPKGELIMRFKGSPEAVRSLSIPKTGDWFFSACNDGPSRLVRKWDWTGSVVQVYKGHGDYVYEVVTDSQGRLLSCGEDHTARVWTDDGDADVLEHPCQTVWAVDGLDNGDIVTAGSDGKVRIWTVDRSRLAVSSILEAYQAEVATAMSSKAARSAAKISAQQGGDVPQVTIGIDISDDEPAIPLTFDPRDDPRIVAEEFVQRKALPTSYISQIEDFITANIGGRPRAG